MSPADRISGRLVQSYSFTTAAEPGWAQHRRHQSDVPAPTDRDNAPGGGGWQPDEWDSEPAQIVLSGDNQPTSRGHRRTASHDGDEPRGAGQRRVPADSLDRFQGGPSGTSPLIGAGGAANGGLRAEGSIGWMNPGASRRRADGGQVTRAPGFRLGYRYVINTQEHRQGLHMNKPTIRGVREKQIIKGRDPSIRTNGPLAPTARTIIPPYTAPADTLRTPPASPDVIGGGWVM